jgi:ribosomal protein S18 acetylase RimI-like enzyme
VPPPLGNPAEDRIDLRFAQALRYSFEEVAARQGHREPRWLLRRPGEQVVPAAALACYYEDTPMTAARQPITFTPFTSEALASVEPWFDDPETDRWLGGREWPENLLRLLADPPREHRGSVVRERVALVARADGESLALVDAEIYTDDSAAVSLIVAPNRRRRGLGAATLRALGAHLAGCGVRALVGGVEQHNTASLRCVERAGFVAVSGKPDEEGFIDYVLRLERVPE